MRDGGEKILVAILTNAQFRCELDLGSTRVIRNLVDGESQLRRAKIQDEE